MTKSDLVSAVVEKTGAKKKDVVAIVDEVFSAITAKLAKGEKVTFVGFGIFEVRQRAAREGRNPQDPKKKIKIPARKVPAFRPGKILKEKVLASK